MTPDFQNESNSLLSSSRFLKAKSEMLQTIEDASRKVRSVKGPSSQAISELYLKTIQDMNKSRGRDLFFPYLASGLGSGPFVELADGSVKYDMITGIGIGFFGHTHPELMGEMVQALSADIMQGNLQPGHEAYDLIKLILSKVGSACRLKHGWLMCSGTMSNEVALKIIRQKKNPATKVLAFRDCFAGRSTAMQEITDNPKYREGQPTYGEVAYLPFYDAEKGLEASVEQTLQAMKQELGKQPGKFAALMIELVQGEGGFQYGPRDFYVRVFEEAKKEGLAIWLDEIQTFGRTGELFAYQTFGLEPYVDVVTIGKMFQACMVLYTSEYNPKPGLVAGTFSGSTVALRTARKTLELLESGGFLGKNGKIEKLSSRFSENLKKLKQGSCAGMIGDVRVLGGMVAFVPFQGTMDEVKSVLMRLFDLGVIAFYCGHGPNLIRMLPPLGAMTEADVDAVCGLIEKAFLQVREKETRK